MKRAVLASATALLMVIFGLAPAAHADTDTFTVTGLVLRADGSPAPQAWVDFFARSGNGAQFDAGSDGRYSVQLPSDVYSVDVGIDGSGDEGTTFAITTIDVAGPTDDTFQAPPTANLETRVLDESGRPVGAGLDVDAYYSAVQGPPPGPTASAVTYAGGGTRSDSTTAADGTATVSALLNSQTVIHVTRPHDEPESFSESVPTDPTSVTLQLGHTYLVSGKIISADGTAATDTGVDLTDASTDQTISTTTAGDGSYQFGVPSGDYRLTAEQPSSEYAPPPIDVDANLHVTADLEHDIVLPELGNVEVRVQDSAGNPVAGSAVTATNTALRRTEADGTIDTFDVDVNPAFAPHTENNGLAAIPALVGTTPTITESRPATLSTSTVVEVDKDQTSATVTVPPDLPIDGSVSEPDGTAPTNATAEITDGKGDSADVSIGGDGHYTLYGPAGSYAESIIGIVAPVRFTATGSVTAGATTGLTLPPTAQVKLTVVDATYLPVGYAGLESDSATPVDVLATDGSSFAVVPDPSPDQPLIAFQSHFSTAADGTSSYHTMLGSSTDLLVTPPRGASSGYPATVDTPDPVSNETVRLAWYSQVASEGTAAGSVAVAGPQDATLSDVRTTPASTTPDGAQPLVGTVAYQVSGLTPGASTDVTLALPPGSNPRRVYQAVGNHLIDVSSRATFSGDDVVMTVTDGGDGDADGLRNGTIVQSLVPVGQTPATVRTRSLPAAHLGRAYRVQLSGTGTGPLSWSVAQGRLPAGLRLSSDGWITGTPTRASAQRVAFRVVDSTGGSATATIPVSVAGPSIVTRALPRGREGARYSAALASDDRFTPITWVISRGSLPPGVSLTRAGRITGRPRRAGRWTIVLRAIDPYGNACQRRFTVVVVARR